MSEAGKSAEIADLAHERAAKYAPRPSFDPVHAGIAGAGICGIVVAVFMGFARLKSDAFSMAVTLTIALGFLIPFGYLKNMERIHTAAWAKEYEALGESRVRE